MVYHVRLFLNIGIVGYVIVIAVLGTISAMFLASWAATLAPLLLLAPAPTSLVAVAGIAAVTSLGATAVETISPWGIDNLAVPAISALILAPMLQ